MSKDTVTLRDVYAVMQRVEDKMDKRFEETDGRIDKIEGFQNKLMGIASILSVLFASGISFIYNKLFMK